MKISSTGAVFAAPHSITQAKRVRARTFMMGVLLSSVSSAAFAEVAQTPAPPPATNGTQAASDQGLGNIIVTATKRETNLQQTPIAISVANAQALQDRHVQSLFNLADGSIPSLRVATFEARQSALTVGIRGIVPYDKNRLPVTTASVSTWTALRSERHRASTPHCSTLSGSRF